MLEGALEMDEGENRTLPSKAQILREIEEDRVLIERSERRSAELPRIILEEERRKRRLLQIIRQLART